MKALLLFLAILFAGTATAQTGIIQGKVTDALTNEPIMFATVAVSGTTLGTTTDLDGQYLLGDLPVGLYTIAVSYVGYEDQARYEIQVSSGRPVILDFQLEEQTTQLEEVVVKASPFKRTEESPLSLRTIGVAEIQRNPGGNRDISKVIQTLPGVTSVSSFRNDLIIRGGAPNENRFYLDEVEVPTINHFATQGASGGPVGLINVNFIREVDFYSGAFPANRGNSLSSIFNFQQADGRSDRIGGTALLSATDIGATLEGPIGDKTTFLLSARRSYLQFLFQALGLPFLPTYNDFQAKVKYKIDQKNELTFIGLGAIDQFRLNLEADETEEQQFLLNNLPESPQWNYTNGLVYKHFTDQGYWTFVLSRNMLNNQAIKYADNDESSEDNKILDYKSQEIENKLRIENTTRYGDIKINVGVGYEYVKYNNRTFNRIFTSAGAQTVDFRSDLAFHKAAIFGQISRKMINDRLVVSAGLRLDANSYSDEMQNPLEQISPRLSVSYAITDRLSINANSGRFYQLPPYTVLGYQEGGRLINRENGIEFIRADHFVAGLAYNTATSSKISIEAYYKSYSDYPFLLRDSLTLANLGGDFGVVGNEPAISRSAGRTYGVEVLFQQRLFKGFYGIAAYTLGWSEFEDKDGRFVPSSWDARHIVNLTLGKRFGRNWEAGINWRFQTGLPFTPFASTSNLAQNWDVTGRGIPDYSQLNTQRTSVVNGLDIRIDKKWFFPRWSLNVYLDIENVTANAVGLPQLILDRPLDENNRPVGGPVVINPNDPPEQQRYALKEINDATGTRIPSIGVMVEW
ncbi:MAG: TonB-dependent receptor [Lewinellaceae bacterium]|nr:TonB-dependent receptor [Lewinellaceae bacterium]